ncbi:hypothetical protein SBY92_005030 [Candida maltosa Xu316]
MSEKSSHTNSKDITDSKQLINIYKKKGKFDNQRKLLLDNFKQSETYKNLLLKLKLLIDNKIKQDSSILMKNKGKMAALIQGEIITNDKNELLKIVDKDIQDKIIDSFEFHNTIKDELIDIKQELLGDENEELTKLKKQGQIKLERLKLESKLNELRLIQQHHHHNHQHQHQHHHHHQNSGHQNNFKSKSQSQDYRVNKPSQSKNTSNNKPKKFMMY